MQMGLHPYSARHKKVPIRIKINSGIITILMKFGTKEMLKYSEWIKIMLITLIGYTNKIILF